MKPGPCKPEVSAKMPALDFIVAGGGPIGLGHIARCASLARCARERGWSVRCFLDGDEAGRAAWRARTDTEIDGDWSAWPVSGPSRVVALDTPFPKTTWISRLKGSNHALLLIDDLRSAESADWVLLPGLHHPTTTNEQDAGDDARTPGMPPSPRRLAGPRYAILSEAHRCVEHRPLPSRERMLLSLGGSDPHHATPRIARALADLLDHDMRSQVDVVLGPCFHDPGARVARELATLGFEIHPPVDSGAMARLMARARLAFVGFGTSLTELAWHGTPFVCVTHSRSDVVHARALSRSGLGRLLGHASDLDADSLGPLLQAALTDVEWQRRSAALGRAAIGDGEGVQRALREIESDLGGNRTRRAGDQPTLGAHDPAEAEGPCAAA